MPCSMTPGDTTRHVAVEACGRGRKELRHILLAVRSGWHRCRKTTGYNPPCLGKADALKFITHKRDSQPLLGRLISGLSCPCVGENA